MKDWEVVADNLKKAGFSVGWVSSLDPEGRMIWIVDAHGYGKRFVVRADEMLTAFLELESAIGAETPRRDLIKRATEVGQYPQRDQIDADQ
jgi:hypothetical protein